MAMDKGSKSSYSTRGGGGEPEAPAPPPPAPSPLETSAEAITAQIDAVPRILETQQEYGPQFSQMQLDQLKEFGPQYAEEGLNLSQQFGTQFAEQMKAEQDILDPSRTRGSEAINQYLEEGYEDLTSTERSTIQEDARSAGSARGLAESGFGAVDEVSRLFNARQQLKSRYLNVALAASGRLPNTQTGQTVQAGQAGYAPQQLVQNVSPTSIFGAQASNNNFASSNFGTQSNIFGSQVQMRGQNMSMISDIAGGAMGAVGGMI